MYNITRKGFFNMIKKFFLLKLPIIVFFSCRAINNIDCENKQLEKEIKKYVKDLRRNQPEIRAVVVESFVKEDSTFVSLLNSYPIIDSIKAYVNYKGIVFCFSGEYPLKGYYKVVNPAPLPKRLKIKYEEIMQGKYLGYYEPYARYLAFYKGKLVSKN